MGGYRAGISDEVECYSMATDKWEILTVKMPKGLWQLGTYTIDHRSILVVGGEGTGASSNKVSLVFDVKNKEFHSFVTFPAHKGWLFFWLLVVRRGHNLFVMNPERSVMRYNIVSNAWEQLDTMQIVK